jgi:hypothetical protein
MRNASCSGSKMSRAIHAAPDPATYPPPPRDAVQPVLAPRNRDHMLPMQGAVIVKSRRQIIGTQAGLQGATSSPPGSAGFHGKERPQRSRSHRKSRCDAHRGSRRVAPSDRKTSAGYGCVVWPGRQRDARNPPRRRLEATANEPHDRERNGSGRAVRNLVAPGCRRMAAPTR